MSKINWQGKEVEAFDVDFRVSREDWCEYSLLDGSTIKMKAVVSSIIRLEGEYDTEGNPCYLVKSNNMVVVKSPEHLKKGAM